MVMWLSVRVALLLSLVLSACAPQQPYAEPLPTVMLLPTLPPTQTPTRTPRPTLTATLPPSETPVPATATPDSMQTQFAALNATNAAAQAALASLQTQLAVPTEAIATSVPITQAISSPTDTPDPISEMPPTTLYARDVVPLRACADRTCEPLHLLSVGNGLIVNGFVNADMIDAGNGLWYRADWFGRSVYVYSGYLTASAPTPLPVFLPEVTPPVQAAAPAPNVCPRNCTEARAWGYSAEQAAACGLDRDRDGVACYGD